MWAAGFGALVIQAFTGLFVFSQASPVVIRTVSIYSLLKATFFIFVEVKTKSERDKR